jgi:sterol desaturase/sphingolipid hydroxylase (fatty acid hydroxylase superfamily)
MWETLKDSYIGYARYLWNDITLSNGGGFFKSYFWLLLLVSLFFFVLEIIRPWREKQPKFRKDFWLDFFYMFFNFFLFSLVIYHAGSMLVVNWINGLVLNATGFDLQGSNPMNSWPLWAILITGFLVRDFIQWWVHRLLHFVPRLWEFHKVHHSVRQMGFAAHLRYHWMENVVYRSIEYLPLALLGIGLHDFFVIHIFALAWGHYNHANFSVNKRWTGSIVGALVSALVVLTGTDFNVAYSLLLIVLGTLFGGFVLGKWMPVIFNSPEMHIWHHAKEMPADKPYGINFGLTLAVWDYIFGTARIPHDGKDIELGFDRVEEFPEDFVGQNLHGFGKTSS